MGKHGPARSCNCGNLIGCRICRRREQQRRYANGLERLPRLPNATRVRESRLRLPDEPSSIAYLAGLFDGEGCVTSSNGYPIIQIGMTHRGVIEYLVGLGGTMREERKPAPRRTLYRWRILAGIEVAEFLTAVLPYLRVKDDDAKAALGRLDELLDLERLA